MLLQHWHWYIYPTFVADMQKSPEFGVFPFLTKVIFKPFSGIKHLHIAQPHNHSELNKKQSHPRQKCTNSKPQHTKIYQTSSTASLYIPFPPKNGMIIGGALFTPK